jgi:NADPH:quinone reductase
VRAIRVLRNGGPEVLEPHEVADPAPPTGDEVLVRVFAAGVNPVEVYVREGGYAGATPPPYTPGTDAGGLVEAVGDAVGDLAVGDRVYTSGSLTGTYAELALCRRAQVHPLPEAATFAAGAALGVPYATAWRAILQRGSARAGETLLVHGASGGVGTAAVQIGVAAGLEVSGTAGTTAGRRLVRSLGAVHVADHTRPGHIEGLRSLTGGRGFDLIVEMLAGINLGDDLTLLAAGGRVVIVGSRGAVEVDPRDLMSREADVRGMLLPNATVEDLSEIHTALAAGLRDGSLTPIVARELPLDKADVAHRLIMESSHRGKIVLVP